MVALIDFTEAAGGWWFARDARGRFVTTARTYTILTERVSARR